MESLLVFSLYFIAGRVGLAMPFTDTTVAPVWPAAGVALGSLLIFGRHVWIGIAAGAFLVNYVTPVPPVALLGITCGNTLGPLIAATMLRRHAFVRIQRLSDLLHLVTYGALGFIVSALIGPAAFYLAGVHPWNGFPNASIVWWLSDSLGMLLITPLMVNLSDLKSVKPRIPELLLLLVWLFTSTAVLTHQRVLTEEAFAFALLPFIIWAAVRFSVAGVALAVCMVSSVSVWEAAHGVGPFIAEGLVFYKVGMLQAFLGVLALSGLSLAAVIAERTTIEEALAREEALRAAQERYRMIVETTNDGVCMIDRQFTIVFVNRQMADMLGYRPDEIVGQPLLDLYFPEDVARKKQDLALRRRGVRQVLYYRLRRKDGEEVWALVSSTPLYDNNQEFAGGLALVSDVTLLRRTEEALRRNEKLIAAGRMAATISHEVNNPLAAVVNFFYLIKREPMSGQAQEYLALAEKEVQRISAMTRLTLGFFRDQYSWAELSVADLMDDTLAFYEQRLTDRGVRIVRDYRDSGNLWGARGELQQVFANLMSNALDAMSAGGTLTLCVRGTSDNAGTQVVVEDTGLGILPEHLPNVFEPFFTTKEKTGTGLGLWVAREIIQKHGGTVTVTSRPAPGDGHGTRFAIFLPRAIDRRAVA